MMSGKATESDILAWIEGELPEDRMASVEAAFLADPSLRAWASSMKGDRSALRAWAELASASSPGGLAESALEIVERDALLGPSEAEALAAEPEREIAPLQFKIKRYATAAAIVLLVGVIGVTGVRFGPTTWSGGELEVVQVDPDQTIRLLDEEPSSDPHADLIDAIETAGREDPEASLTIFDEQQIAALSMEGESPASMESARMGQVAPVSRPMGASRDYDSLLADLLGQDAIAGGPVIAITPEVAAATMHRLVVRVRADDPVGLSSAMQKRCQAPDSPAAGWSLIADSGDPGFTIDGAVCTVRLPGEVAGLGWLIDAFNEAGASQVALTLRDASKGNSGFKNAGSKDKAIDAAKALWWGEPITAWASSVRIGVLIEHSEPVSTK
jgi:hypothetical protein